MVCLKTAPTATPSGISNVLVEADLNLGHPIFSSVRRWCLKAHFLVPGLPHPFVAPMRPQCSSQELLQSVDFPLPGELGMQRMVKDGSSKLFKRFAGCDMAAG